MLNFLRLNYFYQNERTFTAFILGGMALFLSLSAFLPLQRLDNLLYDLGHYLAFKKPPQDIVIIAIDQDSLNRIGRWPWSREVHAQLIQRLSKESPRAIGVDVIFAEPEQENPNADALLAQAIQENGRVVLPVLFETPQTGGLVQKTMPLDPFAAVSQLGSVHVPIDADGIARGIYLWEGLGVADTPHFTQTILRVAGLLPKNAPTTPMYAKEQMQTEQLVTKMPRRVLFQGPPGHFNDISYSRVLTGDYPPQFFKDKIVLVGATASGMGDFLPTPVSALSHPMPGVEVHANVIDAMRNEQLVVTVPRWLSALLSVILAITPLLWLSRLAPLRALCLTMLYFFMALLLLLFVPRLLQVWIPSAAGMVAMLFAYPIWSWRKLDAAQKHLDSELETLHDDLAALGVDMQSLQPAANADVLQARISKVQTAAHYLRSLQQNRNDTLSFISHDIRAPLATALLLIKDVDQTKYTARIEQMLSKAHSMAEHFLQASRAEMAHVSKFQPLDVVSLVQQVADDAYETARVKEVALKTHLPDEELWVVGDFGLLQRMLMNILSNAVKYAPEKSSIELDVNQEDDQVLIQITDHGPGIPADKIERLFKRFSRAEGKQQQADGTGLGLYFVEVTIKKHKGEMSVESEVGQFTRFNIRLNLEK